MAQWFDPTLPLKRWRADDLFRLARELADAGVSAFDWLGVGASLATEILLALLTYHFGARLAEPPLTPTHPPPAGRGSTLQATGDNNESGT